jgi:hypothetical protein
MREGNTPGVLYGCENKRVVRRGICNDKKIKAIKIDEPRETHGVGEERKDETGTLSAEP